MGENLDNYSYNNTTDGFEQNLANEIKEVLKEETDILDKQGEEVIKSLDNKKLANYIEKSFKTESGWLTYPDMKNHAGKFHGFMTQAAIDMLGSLDGYKGKKYDINGNVDDNGKTIDDWLKENGGIDNQYGGGTKKIVKMIQHILGIHEDGAAGPQFFAKICSVLEGKAEIDDFRVQGYDGVDNKYSYNFDENNKLNESSLNTYEWSGVTIRLDPGITLAESTSGEDYRVIKYNGKYLKQWLHKKNDGTITVEEHNDHTEQDGFFSITKTGQNGFFRLSYKKPSTPDGNPGDPVDAPVEQQPQVTENIDVDSIKKQLEIFNVGYPFAIITDKQDTLYCGVNYYYDELRIYNADRTKQLSEMNNSEYQDKNYCESGTLYKKVLNAFGRNHISGLFDSKLSQIKESTYNTVVNKLKNNEAVSDTEYQELGDLFCDYSHSEDEIAVGKWLVTHNEDGSGGKDFYERGKLMKSKGMSANAITVETWLAFSRFKDLVGIDVNNISRIIDNKA